MKTRHTLQANPFHLNPSACLRVAQVIQSYRSSAACPSERTDIERALTIKLALVAICHDINWDFLQENLPKLFIDVPTQSVAERLCHVHSSDIKACLGKYPKTNRILAEARSAMLRELGRTLIDNFGNAKMIYERCERRIHGDNGFLKQLDCFKSYSADPLRKKSHVLIQELVRERLARFEDEHLIEPAIDYHIQRLYLRTDRVVCRDRHIEQQLQSYRPRQRPRLVNLLRREVSEALKLTAFYASLPIPDVNYIEWQIGRSVCTKIRPSCIRVKKISSLDADIARLFSRQCPFMDFCPGVKSEDFRRLKQPNFQTSFY